jgi:sugar lactone lactonase YvrE
MKTFSFVPLAAFTFIYAASFIVAFGAAPTPVSTNATSSGPVPEKIVLDAPRSLAVDKDGNVFIADFGASAIYKLTPAGNITRIAGSASASGANDGPALKAGFMNPCGITVDTKGNVYIADTDNGLVRKITPDGNITSLGQAAGNSTSAGKGPQPFGFNNPTSVAVDKDGNVFVACSADASIEKIATDGTVTVFAGKSGESGDKDGPAADARFGGPRGITIDPAGNLYISDEMNSDIRKITPAGNVTTLAGKPNASGDKDGTGTDATFGAPRGLAVDKDGNVFVADTDNNVVRKVTPAGVVTTFAGKAGEGGLADGKGAAARFTGLRGLAVDAAGNVYVADADNGAIRKITPAGEVTTLYGSASKP